MENDSFFADLEQKFNRTNVELKQSIRQQNKHHEREFNRTNVELKLQTECGYRGFGDKFNRTNVELKQVFR